MTIYYSSTSKMWQSCHFNKDKVEFQEALHFGLLRPLLTQIQEIGQHFWKFVYSVIR